MPIWRCTAPRLTDAEPIASSSRRWMPAQKPGLPCSRICVRRSSTAASKFTISRLLISPAEFIPVAEDTGLIVELGEWVLRTACAEAASWPEHVRLAVNVSPVQLKSPTLGLKIAGALAASDLPASRLEL